MTADEIPPEAVDAVVPLDALYRVILQMFFNNNNTNHGNVQNAYPVAQSIEQT